MAQALPGEVDEGFVATLPVGPGVGICVLGFDAEARDEAGGGVEPQPQDFIGFQTRLEGLQLPPQPPILQPVVEASKPIARQVANFILKRVLRMAGESFLSH